MTPQQKLAALRSTLGRLFSQHLTMLIIQITNHPLELEHTNSFEIGDDEVTITVEITVTTHPEPEA